MERMIYMLDGRAVLGTLATMTAAGSSWLEIAGPIVTMTVTVLVGGATLWYTVERAMKLRKERKDGDSKSSGRKGSNGSDEGSMGDSQR
jgi:uncharacterized membrane protein YgcG